MADENKSMEELDIDRDKTVEGWRATNKSEFQAPNVKIDPNSGSGKAYQDIVIRYAKALEVSGLNVADHNFANAFYYNKSGMNLSDPPQVGKSIVFITRPDLNWARANIRAVPYFDYMFETVLGKQIMCQLTHPHRFINHVYHTDDFVQQKTIVDKFWDFVKAAQNAWTGAGSDISKVNDYDLYNNDIINTMNQFKSAWDSRKDGYKIEEQTNDWGNKQNFDFRMNKEPVIANPGTYYTWKANRVPMRYLKNKHMNKNVEDFVNYQSPFIPLLTNACMELPGARDFMLGSKETEGDYYGGRLNYPTGAGEINACGEISLTFEDNIWSHVFHLFYSWVLYIDLVSRGEILPRISNIWEKILDYTCSIYVFVLDKDQTTLRGWAKYTGCYPRSVPMGQIMHTAKGENDNWRTISIPFSYNHMEYMDPQIFTDFNYVAGTEYDRVIKRDFKGFCLHNSKVKRYTDKDIFQSVTTDGENGTIKLGVSGQFPERALKIEEENYATPDDMQQKQIKELNLTMPAKQRITYHNHWNGFPMINSGRLIWLHSDSHPVKLDDSGAVADSEDLMAQEVAQNQEILANTQDPEEVESIATSSDITTDE